MSLRCQQHSSFARLDLSYDKHSEGGPGVVLNFTVSSLGEGGIKKLTLDSHSKHLTTPGTIENSQKFD